MSRSRGWTVGAMAVLLLLAIAGIFFRKPIKRLFKQPKPLSTGRFQDPEGMAVDRAGNFYVADEDTGTLYMLDRSGTIVTRVQKLEGVDGPVTGGDSIAVIEPGHIVAIGDHCLLEIRFEGGAARLVRAIGRRGSGDGEFEDPEGISRDPATGEIYATDEDHRRILVFDREGKYARMFKVDHDPEAVCVFEDRVYVTFSKNAYAACYAKDGRPRFTFGGDRLKEPDFACVSPDRRLYVTDQRANRIVVFDLDGTFLFDFGGEGPEPGKFNQPEDLAFDPDGNLVVADGDNHRLQVLTPDGKPVRVIE